MSNRRWNQLTKLEQRLIKLPHYQGGPSKPDGYVPMTVERIGGFEWFNTRPYHNYETWGAGWQIILHDWDPAIIVRREDLEDAIALAEQVKETRKDELSDPPL